MAGKQGRLSIAFQDLDILRFIKYGFPGLSIERDLLFLIINAGEQRPRRGTLCAVDGKSIDCTECRVLRTHLRNLVLLANAAPLDLLLRHAVTLNT